MDVSERSAESCLKGHPCGGKHSFLHLQHKGGEVRSRGSHYLFLGHKIECPDGIDDGIFVEWHWDGSSLFVKTDRYGIYPLYYFGNSNEICLSPSLITLLKQDAPTEIDEEAMAVFLRIGFFLDTDTPFSAIRTLPPGGILKWSPGSLNVWGKIPFAKPQTASRDEVIDRFIELFQIAIAKRKPPTPDVVVPLSGGRDSRHIVCELVAQGYAPKFCVTMRYPPPYSSEDEVAAALCRATEVPHRVVGPAELSVELELEKNLETNFSTFENGWGKALYNEMRAEASVVYDGAAGDVFSAAHFNTPERIEMFDSGRLGDFAEQMLHFEAGLELLVKPRKYCRLNREIARQRLLREVERHASAPNPVASFFFFNRTRRVAAVPPFSIMHHVPYAYLPFTDRDIFDFLMGFHGSMFIDYQLHTDALKRAYPQVANIPFVFKTKLKGGHAYFRRFSYEVMQVGLSQRSDWVRRTTHMPRLLRCMVQPSYGIAITQWLGVIPLYLYQLEAIVRGRCCTRKQDGLHQYLLE